MKICVSLLLLALPMLLSSQEFEPKYPTKDGVIHYENVVEVDSATAKDLYNRCKVWVGKTFKSAKNVIQSDTEDEVVLDSWLPIYIKSLMSTSEQQCWFRLSISFKDGKFKYVLNKVFIETTAMKVPADDWIKDSRCFNKKGEPKKALSGMSYRKQVVEGLNGIVNSLEKAMKTDPKKSDW